MTKDTQDAAPAFTTNLHNIFHTDENLEENGTWVTVNDFLKLRIKIRRLNSDPVVKAFERIVRETYDNGEELARSPQDATEEQSMLVLKRQLAEAVMVDWEGVRDTSTGKLIPFSVEAAMQMLEMKDFRDFVYTRAEKADEFKAKSDKDAAGNSSSS